MENKAHAIAAGAFVLSLIAVLVALVVWLTRDNAVRNIYEISTRDPVSGLQPQAMVRYRGIAVGKVTLIDFDPKAKGNVRVRITVDEKVPLTTSSYATLSYQGVTGLAFIALDDKGESTEPLKPDNDNPPRIQLRPSMLAQLQERGELIIGQVETMTRRVNQMVGDDNQKRIADALENIALATASANVLAKRLDNTIQTRLDPALAAIPPLASSARESLGTFRTTASDFSRVAGSLNTTITRLNAEGGTIERLGNGTAALAQTLESLNTTTLPRFNRAADDTSLAARRLSRVAEGIADNPQSLLYGTGVPLPGPGEPGFNVPAARP